MPLKALFLVCKCYREIKEVNLCFNLIQDTIFNGLRQAVTEIQLILSLF